MDNITVFMVEDHKLLRDAWKAIFETHQHIEVLGEADTVEDGFAQIDLLKPNIVLLDINLKGDSGTELIKKLKNTMPFIKILVVSMHNEYVFVKKMFSLGIHGYVTKYADSSNLLQAIEKVKRGEIYLSEDLQKLFIERSMSDEKQSYLTFKEVEVIRLICEGKNNKEMAQILDISVKTIEGHKTNIYKKLKINSQTGILKYAQANGIF